MVELEGWNRILPGDRVGGNVVEIALGVPIADLESQMRNNSIACEYHSSAWHKRNEASGNIHRHDQLEPHRRGNLNLNNKVEIHLFKARCSTKDYMEITRQII